VANPSTLSVGSRVVWSPGFVSGGPPLNPAPVPLGTVLPPVGGTTPAVVFGLVCEIAGMTANQGSPLPGLCQTVAGSAPDFVGSTALIHDQAGKPFLVAMGVNATTWASGGSVVGQRRWQYVDLAT
jgi:hypothetical protein